MPVLTGSTQQLPTLTTDAKKPPGQPDDANSRLWLVHHAHALRYTDAHYDEWQCDVCAEQCEGPRYRCAEGNAECEDYDVCLGCACVSQTSKSDKQAPRQQESETTSEGNQCNAASGLGVGSADDESVLATQSMPCRPELEEKGTATFAGNQNKPSPGEAVSASRASLPLIPAAAPVPATKLPLLLPPCSASCDWEQRRRLGMVQNILEEQWHTLMHMPVTPETLFLRAVLCQGVTEKEDTAERKVWDRWRQRFGHPAARSPMPALPSLGLPTEPDTARAQETATESTSALTACWCAAPKPA